MKQLLSAVLFLVILLPVVAQKKLAKSDLQDLKHRMKGSFSSEAQSKLDTSFFDIRLHMEPIWTHRTDGFWLYVEQAMATALQTPYRQRIYHVYQQNDSCFVSKVYELKQSKPFIGAYTKPTVFDSMSIDSLVDRIGCSIYLYKDAKGNFYGSTPGKECISNLRGAAYASSEVIIEMDKLLSWDRGWNAADEQVWGAKKGGYQFIKINPIE